MRRVAVIGSTGQLGSDLVRVLRSPVPSSPAGKTPAPGEVPAWEGEAPAEPHVPFPLRGEASSFLSPSMGEASSFPSPLMGEASSFPSPSMGEGEGGGEHPPFEVFSLSHREIEVTDPDSVRRTLTSIHPDVVINCAAFVRVDECEDRPGEALRVNALGALHVARVCAGLDALCVYISTDYVFDGEKKEPYTEEDPPRPLNVYGVSKLCGEHFVRASCPRHLIVRTSGLYGVAGSSGKGGNFVETMIRLAGEGKPIRVVDDQVLAPTYTRDLAEKIRKLLQEEVHGVVHIANGGQCSWYGFAQGIFDLLGLEPDLKPTSSSSYGARARRPAYSVLACQRLGSLGLGPMRPWQEALEAYLSEKGYLSLTK